MPKTVVNCPNCRQPVQADINQLFDVGIDPDAKQMLLSGLFNVIQCPSCGYQGKLATPIVYHDPSKELLLTFIPPEINLPKNEQERVIGSMIKRAIDALPMEKRKAYLLQPQTALSLQGMLERILEADGITREMIQAQQQRLNLIQRLLGASEDVRAEIVKQEDQHIDMDFFALLNRLAETSVMSGDQESAQKLSGLQKSLLSLSTVGRQLQEQTQEVEAAIKSLNEAGKGLTREKLLEIIIQAPSEARLKALVSLARPGMDYSFFQLLSERIDRARGEGRDRLVELREQLLKLTGEIDKQVEQRVAQAREMLEQILQEDDVAEGLLHNLSAVDDFFVQELSLALENATKQGDQARLAKLQKMAATLQEINAAPPEVAFIEQLLDAPNDQARTEMLEANKDKVTPEFIDALTNIVSQVQSGEDAELAARIQSLYRIALSYSMRAQLKS